MLKHHSSRRSRLDQGVLNERLQGAISYDRIAGYFRSSLLEVAGEAITGVSGKVRIICNSDLDPDDLATATAAQAALRRSWCAGQPELAPPNALPRYKALYDALLSDKIEIRVLPDTAFGLIHGKAGVIRYANGSSTAFLGSVNESASAWKLNYELLWESDDPETVAWVQEEFDFLWNDHRAHALADCPFIQNDVQRIINRQVVEPEKLQSSKVMEAAAAAAVETPIYRREQGLWPHQKYFASLALERHRLGGARLVLADQVGLGKTIQLAMAALLMALEDPQGGPILVLVPKPLLQQWRDELMELLQLPSAYWNGRSWVDENDVEHPSEGAKSLSKCPRRIGLVSQGLIVRGMQEAIRQLLNQRYTCVIVDEAHRARRRNRPKMDAGQPEVDEKAEPNKLMAFLCQIGDKTKSMLLATATPLQLHPVEAWDLLSILSNGNEGVLGSITTKTSRWFSAYRTIQIATGGQTVPADDEVEGWEFVRDPLPAATEHDAIKKIRRHLRAPDKKWQFTPETLKKLPVAVRQVELKNKLLPEYGECFNPLLRCIVRRTRSYLEQEINPVTGSYYLPKVEVKLFGEDDNDAITLGGYFKEAYEEAEKFSELLQNRMRGAGFFKTLLLRRLGSSMEAGRNTMGKLLNITPDTADDEDEDDIDEDIFGNEGQEKSFSEFRNFSTDEIASLERCLNLLKQGGNRDSKLEAILGYLLGTNPNAIERWVDRGCILFSQYYDTVRWMGDELAKHPEIPSNLTIGLYAGSNRSGFWLGGCFQRCDRTLLKDRVRKGEIKLLLGTDAASEGLNLQRLGTLINIDLPWNPTRLEQRKGRIQRISQARNQVWIANLRYRDSVEDKVHKVLAERLQAIHELFGQIPDTLEDIWVKVALNDEAKIAELIDQTTAARNPFDKKYSKVEDAAWEICSSVLNPISVRELMEQGWE